MLKPKDIRTYMYTIIIFIIGLSGFAQMPIFKRYYIADIPGLGWLAQFYVTHMIHYIAATILIAFTTYIFFDFLLKRSQIGKITGSGYFKIGTLVGLIITGILMVIRNLPGVYFDHQFIIGLNIIHLSFCMVLCVAGTYTLLLKKRWVK